MVGRGVTDDGGQMTPTSSACVQSDTFQPPNGQSVRRCSVAWQLIESIKISPGPGPNLPSRTSIPFDGSLKKKFCFEMEQIYLSYSNVVI
jgi:hypothetical protein